MDPELIGGFLAVLAALLASFRYYFVRKIRSPRGIINTIIVSYILGSLFFTLLSIIMNYPNFSLSRWWFIFVVTGLLGVPLIWCMYEGVRRIGASRTSPITRGNMLIASLIGIFFLGETVKSLHLVGIILLFIGVALVSYESSKNNSNSKSIFSLNLIFPLIAMLLIGAVSPLISLGYDKGVPVTIGIATSRLSSLSVTVLFFQYKGWSLLEPFRSQDRGLYLGAAIAFSGMIASVFFALSIAPVSVVSPLRGTGPLFVLIISYFCLKRLEIITKKLVVGVFFTVIGAMLIAIFM